MAAKFFFVLCASALLVNTITACGGGCGGGYILPASINLGGGCGCGQGYITPSYVASASGGGFGITSASPIAPSGVSLVSENAIEGPLEVYGSLPLLAAVAFEGNVPSAGAAGVDYSCGNGNVGISAESLAAAGLGAGRAGAYGLGAAGLGSGIYSAGITGLNAGIAGLNAGIAGLARPGWGCGIC